MNPHLLWTDTGRLFEDYLSRGSVKSKLSEATIYSNRGVSRSKNRSFAIRYTGLDRSFAVQQVWDMMHVQDVEGFERTVGRLQMPVGNVINGDHAGHILYIHNGHIPERTCGDSSYWNISSVPGYQSNLLWNQLHDYTKIPKVKDPESGWIQNTNAPPWNSSFPSYLSPKDFPDYFPHKRIDFRTLTA